MSSSTAAKKRLRKLNHLLARDGDKCRWCGRRFWEGLPPTFDHIIPQSRGGTLRLENLVLACAACNRRRGDDSVLDFLEPPELKLAWAGALA